ncbi:C40 family peptidase [Nonomuraea sp. NPDC049400]|uniref:C40 family peptidase n=1 Tax=Nonomuraea sp. NPDC049400 TaxID=3364352 RepID=UPI0037B03196
MKRNVSLTVRAAITAISAAGLLAMPTMASAAAGDATRTTVAASSAFAAATVPESYIMRAVNVALQQLGKPYQWGAEGPDSFDCSGLIYYSYNNPPVLIGRQTWDQAAQTRLISYSQLRSGDLIFYNNYEHVAMYIGNGQVVEAPSSGGQVRIAALRYSGEPRTYRA